MNNFEFILIIILLLIVVSEIKCEHFGSLEDGYKYNDNLNINLDKINPKLGIDLVNSKMPEKQNPNYNTVNDMPKLVLDNGNGYYQNRIKVIENNDSDLMKLYYQNQKQVSNETNKCKKINKTKDMLKTNSEYDGYNNYNVVYSNINAIGKDLLTPFESFPIPYTEGLNN
jgi:hypothetical protein